MNQEAYSTGLRAGFAYSNKGIDKGIWEIPENPYKPGSPDAEAYEKGFWDAANDLEDAFYA